MNITEFIDKLTFNNLQPTDSLRGVIGSGVYREPYHPDSASSAEFEIRNTVLPFVDKERIRRLHTLLRLPRMSTLAIAAIINHAVSLMPEECSYTNVGIWYGFTLLSGMICNGNKCCIGIDDFSQFGGPKESFLAQFYASRSDKHLFYEATFRQYFETNLISPIGVYMYDGNHNYDNQLDGLRLAEPFFANGAIVLIDDTNWKEPSQATDDFIKGSRRQYKVLFKSVTAHDSHPTFWNGLTLLQCD